MLAAINQPASLSSGGYPATPCAYVWNGIIYGRSLARQQFEKRVEPTRLGPCVALTTRVIDAEDDPR